MAKFDIYQAVTDRILDMLDRGTAPWRSPIRVAGSEGQVAGLPTNLISQKAYRGLNVFLLACTAIMEGYVSPYWLTYKQAQSRGGHVRRGEKSSLVIFWKRYAAQDRETGQDVTVPLLRHYKVFNAEQCDGLDKDNPTGQAPAAETEIEQPVDPITDVQDVVDGFPSPPRIEHAGYQAFYEPKADRVQIAPAQRFASHESYYATLFHELAHATGHSTRLNRGLDEQPPPFGSPDYSKEELIAEMGAAFLCAVAGISPATIELSAAYIDGWRRKLKDNKKLLVQAAGQGQRAADHILGVNWDESGNIVAATAPGRDVSVQPAPIDLG